MEAATRAWRALGYDVSRAIELARVEIASDPTDGWAWLPLVEGLRRAGRSEEASIANSFLRARSGDTVRLVAVGHLAAGLRTWWTPEAERHYQAVVDIGRAVDDSTCIATGLIGLARSSRFTLRNARPDLADEALEVAAADPACRADALRERSAHAILQGDHDLAWRLVESALEIHEALGDEVLAANALLLRGRIERDAGSGRIASLREAHRRSVAAGALDAASDVALFLAPALGRAKTPDQPEWREALEMTEANLAFKSTYDEFGAAECRTVLASLLALTDPERAMAEARRAKAFFTHIGNELGIANTWKAIGRLHLLTAKDAWHGTWFRTAVVAPAMASRGLVELARAKAGYTLANMPFLAERMRIEIALVNAAKGGLPIDDEQLEHLTRTLRQFDYLTDARLQLLRGLTHLPRRPRRAVRELRKVVAAQAELNSTQLAVVALAALAEGYRLTGHRRLAADAAARFVDASESIRVSVPGPISLNLLETVKRPYEYALERAIEAQNAPMALRMLERLRTERLLSLFSNRRQTTPEDEIERITNQLADIDEALAQLRGTDAGRPTALSLVPTDLLVARPHDADDGEVQLLLRRQHLLQELEAESNVVFASLYAPTGLDIEAAVAALDPSEHVLALRESNRGGPHVIAVWRTPTRGWTVEELSLSEDVTTLIDALTAPDGAARQDLCVADAAPLGAVLPSLLAQSILSATGDPATLRIVPSGRLWAVPFLALPLDGHTLVVDRANVIITPSLRMLATANSRQRQPSRGTRMLSWLSEEFAFLAYELEPFREHEMIEVHTASEFAIGLADESVTIAVASSHGNSNPGLAQSLLEHDRPVLTAGHLLSRPCMADTVVLACCHGLYSPGIDYDEPIGLATAILTAGAKFVIGNHIEMAIEDPGRVLELVYRQLAHGASAPTAVGQAIRGLLLTAPHNRNVPLVEWPALNVVGFATDD